MANSPNFQGLPDTNTLIQVVPNLKRAQKFILDKFFPNIAMSDTEFVSIDVDVGKRRMSPFVSPLVEGKLVEQRRYQTNILKPAYIKDKRAPDLLKPIRRQIGERIGGELTGVDRMQANLMFEMEDQIDMLDRRLEWMAVQSMLNAKVTIAGEGYEPVEVDFGRNSDLTIALSGANKWDQAGVRPSASIEDWGVRVLKASGAVCTDIIFTPKAWQYFLRDEVVKNAILYPGSGAGNTINIGPEVQTGAIYKGRWGQYDLWIYNDWYVDDDDKEQQMLPDGTVLMSGAQMMGTRAFGQILDPKFSYAALPYAPKIWAVEDPAQILLMMQSSPIVIPSQVNACLAATVV